MIKECKNHGMTEFSEYKNNTSRCKKCLCISVSNRRRKVKLDLVKFFGGKCIKCGYNKCQSVLQFHHRNPKDKEFGLSEAGVTKSFKKLVEEAKKCDLLCANCHAEEHYKIGR